MDGSLGHGLPKKCRRPAKRDRTDMMQWRKSRQKKTRREKMREGERREKESSLKDSIDKKGKMCPTLQKR